MPAYFWDTTLGRRCRFFLLAQGASSSSWWGAGPPHRPGFRRTWAWRVPWESDTCRVVPIERLGPAEPVNDNGTLYGNVLCGEGRDED